MARTKIVATIGPTSDDGETIRKLLNAGMNVARMNFSHGNHQWHRQTVHKLRQIAHQEKKVLAMFGDLQGPKIRLGNIQKEGVYLRAGEELLLTKYRGQPNMVHLPHPEVFEAIRPDAELVFGDGEVEAIVKENRGDILVCRVTVAGLLEARKGINAPATNLSLSSLTEKDKKDLDLICKLDLDYVALSFVRSAEDIRELRALLRSKFSRMPIIAKIEKAEAIAELNEICAEADGVMVARGDLGLDMTPQEIPLLQKRIIRVCNHAGIPVITATQMLQSMVNHPRPTRAEASDVANAILDGTDAVMLSAETASGKFPVEAVQMMHQIAEMTEDAFPYDDWQDRRRIRKGTTDQGDPANVTEAIGTASVAIAEIVNAKAIFTSTMSGHTARQIARYRPIMEIIAVTPLSSTQRQLSLVWGVRCKIIERHFKDTDDMLDVTIQVVDSFEYGYGDRIVITAGIPFNKAGNTNLIYVHEVNDSTPQAESHQDTKAQKRSA